MQIDICNGDADGLCSVVQWRLHAPQEARLITGMKRDIELLETVSAGEHDQLLVCDLSMRRNQRALRRLLDAGVRVQYFDHHEVDAVPMHPGLEAHIDAASDICTSLLVDRHLGGKFRAWALVGAYGDNLGVVADRLGTESGWSAGDRQRLRRLGESINYNAYGDSEQDAMIKPSQLFERLRRFRDPMAFVDGDGIGEELDALRQDDLQRARALTPYRQDRRARVYLLPDAAWSRRVRGSFANILASEHPQRAHALLNATASGDFVVSVRAPMDAPTGAARLCRQFGGDGRTGAAGIDRLPAKQLERFVDAFAATQWSGTTRTPGGI